MVDILPEDLNRFCRQWLSAWSGNRPEYLISFRITGLDLVQMSQGKIIRNEVYFDTRPLEKSPQ